MSSEDDVAGLGRALAFGARPQRRQGESSGDTVPRGDAAQGPDASSEPHVLTLDLNLTLWHEGQPVTRLTGDVDRVTVPGRAVRDDG